MQLVIDIPKDFYKRVMAENGMSYTDAEVVVNAFYLGTVLPKEHGRLIDVDAVEKEMNKSEAEADRNADYYTADKIDCAMEYIINADTIIEADKEAEDEDR